AHRFDPATLKAPQTHPCIHCGQCTNQCKRGGMTERQEYPRIRRMAENQSVVLIASTSPAVRVALGECFGEEPGSFSEGRMISALRAIGFRYVLDTTFAVDLTIMEEASELVRRLKSKWDGESGSGRPMFTSCCPGWVSFAELFYPQLLPDLSSVRSPVMMQGAVVKTWFAKQMEIDPESIVHVAITPCTAKKYEAQRPEMNAAGRAIGNEAIRDVDCALTCRETGQWIYENRIRWNDLPDGEFDSLMGRGSGGAVIFGNTGGVMESALRTAWTMITNEKPPRKLFAFEPVRGLDGVKEASVEIAGHPVKVAVISGSGNLRPFLDAILSGEKSYDFVEVMACPGGCVGGGGQPKPNGNGRPTDALRSSRIAGLYAKDQELPRRCSTENPDVRKFYEEFAGEPLGEISRKLLHTTYTDRGIFRE
ncbi:MAG: [FeFe] hydrogenase, group A, partial [Planctomycetia bacterium]|nr:[FeFe] hydrogenase, group A [Planctomycetia bacterium]